MNVLGTRLAVTSLPDIIFELSSNDKTCPFPVSYIALECSDHKSMIFGRLYKHKGWPRHSHNNNNICIYMYKTVVVCPSVTGGQQKRFDLEQQEAVSLIIERQMLQLGYLCEHQSRH